MRNGEFCDQALVPGQTRALGDLGWRGSFVFGKSFAFQICCRDHMHGELRMDQIQSDVFVSILDCAFAVGYERSVHPADTLSPSQREYARRQWEIFQAWWQHWPGATSGAAG